MNLDTPLTGAFGNAVELWVGDRPEDAGTVCHFLVTAPQYHPLWSQYNVAMVRLVDDLPGFPPPHRQFPGATHELLVITLNPEHGQQNYESMKHIALNGGLPYLTPINLAYQIEGTEDEARYLCGMAARAIVHGVLEPEASNGPERIRASWESSMAKTLAHYRGEEHAP